MKKNENMKKRLTNQEGHGIQRLTNQEGHDIQT